MKRSRTFSSHLRYAPYLMLLPFLLFFLVFKLGPILWGFVYGFMKWDGMSSPVFLGIGNYLGLLRNGRFWKAFGNTLYFVIVYNLVMMGLSLLLAVVLTSKTVALKRFFRTAYFMPMTVSLAIVAIVFDRILARDVGFLNVLLRVVFAHKGDIGWLTDQRLVMPSFMAMRLWKATGYYAAFMCAGLLSVPEEIYESTRIDGAGPARVFFAITLPMIVPVIVFCLIMSTVYSFQLFDEPWILNAGGPADASLTLQILLYQITFISHKFGVGNAVSWVMTSVMVAFSMLYSRILEGRSATSSGAGLA